MKLKSGNEWQFFRNWEFEEKSNKLKDLKTIKAFEIFNNLSILLDCIPQQDIEKLSKKKVQTLISLRKKLDALESWRMLKKNKK